MEDEEDKKDKKDNETAYNSGHHVSISILATQSG